MGSWIDIVFPMLAYLMGAIPFALLIGRAHGVDLRTAGTGNPGAGNLTRTVGLRAGIGAGTLDVLKGLVPVAAVRMLGGDLGSVTFTGLAAVAGHNWSAYLRGKGGRGLATSVGVALGLDPTLLVWTGGWSIAGWRLGGGLAGFLGWGLLPLFATWMHRPLTSVAASSGLALLMMMRRAQGNRGHVSGWEAAIHRVVFDRDPVPDQEVSAAEEATHP